MLQHTKSSQRCAIDIEDDDSVDSIGIPWFKEVRQQPVGERHGPFIHTFFIPKVPSVDGKVYVPKMAGDNADYLTNMQGFGNDAHPLPSFDRRLTLNNWRDLLSMCMLDAGLRLVALQANLQMAIAYLDNPIYEKVPWKFKGTFIALFLLAMVLWLSLGLWTAAGYREFIHPDSPFMELLALFSSTLLVMLSVPNDIVLVPIHFLPFNMGGLHCDADYIEGNVRWPVHTISHQNKPDHDYMDKVGVFVQLPIFILIDLCCSCVNIYVSVYVQIFNYTAMMQMSSSFLYAFIKLSDVVKRWSLRNRLFNVWLKTACDPLMPEGRRSNAINKYIAEGGSKKRLEKALISARMARPSSRRPDGLSQLKRTTTRHREDLYDNQCDDDDSPTSPKSPSPVSPARKLRGTHGGLHMHGMVKAGRQEKLDNLRANLEKKRASLMKNDANMSSLQSVNSQRLPPEATEERRSKDLKGVKSQKSSLSSTRDDADSIRTASTPSSSMSPKDSSVKKKKEGRRSGTGTASTRSPQI